MVESKENLETLSETSSGVEEVLRRHKQRVNEASFKKHKRLLFLAGIFLGLLSILGFYFSSSLSNITSISIRGNNYLEKKYLLEKSKISLDSKYLFTFPFLVEKNLKKDPLIADAKVSYMANRGIEISVKEKGLIGYRYIEEPELLLLDGSIIKLTSDYMDFISRIPLVVGFQDEDSTRLFIKAFARVEEKAIENIAEISQYELKYDPNAIMVYMRDGNYFFASYYSLELINKYNYFASNLEENGVCIFADENLKVSFKKTCPWDEVEVELEYWMDENGQYILNKYGDKVVVHYYKDDKGDFVLDEEGNKVRIPIDKFGNEIIEEVKEEEEVIQEEIQE